MPENEPAHCFQALSRSSFGVSKVLVNFATLLLRSCDDARLTVTYANLVTFRAQEPDKNSVGEIEGRDLRRLAHFRNQYLAAVRAKLSGEKLS